MAHVMGRIPPCWGQCAVHRASKNLERRCSDKPCHCGSKKRKCKAHPAAHTSEGK